MKLLPLALGLAPLSALANIDVPNPAKAHRELARNVVHNLVSRDHRLELRGEKKKRCRVKSTTLTPRPTSTASGSSPTGSSGGSGGGGTTTPTGPSDFKLVLEHSGQTFFDGWDFWNLDDPTHGNVQFLSRGDAEAANLIDVNDQGRAIMRVETTPRVSGNRKSIRIHDQHVFNGGLLIMDAVHMPEGCGTWPAWWSNGPDWPNKGEIDIIEGVHDNDINQSSIHTGSGCSIPESHFGAGAQLVGGANCASAESNNGGCGQLETQTKNNYGKPFNNNGGGVYALKWDNSVGISIFFWERQNIPADITNKAPQPDSWGAPVANWPTSQCDTKSHFIDHIAIFDTTLCGDWAGNVWNNPGPTGQSCAQITGSGSCADFVANNGGAFANAYWEVSYVQYYEPK